MEYHKHMYFAHAGHVHMDEPLNQTISQPLVVMASLLAVAIIVGSSLFILNHLSNRRDVTEHVAADKTDKD